MMMMTMIRSFWTMVIMMLVMSQIFAVAAPVEGQQPELMVGTTTSR